MSIDWAVVLRRIRFAGLVLIGVAIIALDVISSAGPLLNLF